MRFLKPSDSSDIYIGNYAIMIASYYQGTKYNYPISIASANNIIDHDYVDLLRSLYKNYGEFLALALKQGHIRPIQEGDIVKLVRVSLPLQDNGTSSAPKRLSRANLIKMGISSFRATNPFSYKLVLEDLLEKSSKVKSARIPDNVAQSLEEDLLHLAHTSGSILQNSSTTNTCASTTKGAYYGVAAHPVFNPRWFKGALLRIDHALLDTASTPVFQLDTNEAINVKYQKRFSDPLSYDQYYRYTTSKIMV